MMAENLQIIAKKPLKKSFKSEKLKKWDVHFVYETCADVLKILEIKNIHVLGP